MDSGYIYIINANIYVPIIIKEKEAKNLRCVSGGGMIWEEMEGGAGV